MVHGRGRGPRLFTGPRPVTVGATLAVLMCVLMLVLGGCRPPLIGEPQELPAVPTNQNTTVRVPGALPAHFGFGIASLPNTLDYLNAMRATNGTAWDYRYVYLAGGANTGTGWATWSAPTGAFVTDYLRQNASNGYFPCFVYYMLKQSKGPSGGDEAATDLAHLDDPATMHAYYADWTLLMRALGASRQPALVIVEPDLWGYIERPALLNGSNNAASIPASVASAGDADLQGLPDTAQGFAWALLRLRDRYAPNALLALHASPWGTRVDVFTASQATAAALAYQQALFLRTAGLAGTPAGISTFDLVSTDVADHDSGQSGHWWDPTNHTLPDFQRFLAYAYGLAVGTSRRIVLWQVPLGNQYFRTENDTSGHTQGNKAQYILGHVADFANAGIVAVLFGPGNGGTDIYDARGDGITNPAPIATYQCAYCNTHISSYPDDDGGYLRIAVGAYYQHGPLALPARLVPVAA